MVVKQVSINNKDEMTGEVLKELIKEAQCNLPFSLSTKDLIKLLPHGETKIYQMLEQGVIPAKKIGGKWIVSRDKFLVWYYCEIV